MDNGRFGPTIGSSSSDDDKFGYFGGGTPAQAPPALSHFGGPVGESADQIASAPQSSFGGTATIQGSPSGSFASQSTSRRGVPWVALVAVAVVVAALAAGGWWWTHRDAIVLPDHLGALARNSQFSSGAITGQMTFQTGKGSIKEEMAGYGPSPVTTVLLVARGQGVADGSTAKGVVNIGPVACLASKTVLVCARGEGTLAVIVETTASTGTPEGTAALVQEAWSAQ